MAALRRHGSGPAEHPASPRDSAESLRRGAIPVVLHRGSWIVRSRSDGTILGPERDGIFVDDTRLVSGLDWRLGGTSLRPTRRRRGGNDSATFVLANGDATLEVARSIDAAGFVERVTVVAHGDRLATDLDLVLGTDFADVFEVRGLAPHRSRTVTLAWEPDPPALLATYRNAAFARGVAIVVEASDAPVARTASGLHFNVTLDAGRSWSARLRIRPIIDRPWADGLTDAPVWGRSQRSPPPERATARVWKRATVDLESLELQDEDPRRASVVPAAGIPWYAALFGRDALICAIQAISARPDLARGTLVRLAALQATGDDPAREMEPGKIPHELRRGELAELGLIPFAPYYGSHDATPLFLVALSETWRATGDDRLVRDLWPNALCALSWIERDGDRDGDGFQEYAPRAPGGFPHQGWRDSTDAIVDAVGEPAVHPIALAEHQGYAYDARLRLAELAERVGDDAALAARLRAVADRLQRRFDDRFWWPVEGTYALGLDGNKSQIRSATSCGGHLLWSGIVPPERAPLVAARLMAGDLFTGWGLRTLSDRHPAYDPFSYHRGSVWPHDSAIAVAGLRRYGLHAAAERLTDAVLDAAERFPLARLPEVFSGLPRVGRARPVPLRPTVLAQPAAWRSSLDQMGGEVAELLTDANGPQAWAASAVVALIAGRTVALRRGLPEPDQPASAGTKTAAS